MFSLRSEESLGVGEFSDLKLVVDLAVKMGLRMIQLLPVNDTNIHNMWWDSYPYSTLSVFALHPIYVRISDIDNVPEKVKEKVALLRPKLDGKFLDYEATLRNKLELLQEVYEAHKKSFLREQKFSSWFSANEEWLVPYAVFCALRDKFRTADYNKWESYSQVTREQIRELASEKSEHHAQVCFHYFVQFHLSQQLSSVSKYAQANRVALKGDLPIGVDPLSVDCWEHRDLFRMDCSTGAPPDAFSEDGQNWGFPTYDWERMAQNDYKWWRLRLKVMKVCNQSFFWCINIDFFLLELLSCVPH